MKLYNCILLLPVLVLVGSCSSGNQKSDAYGNFEATETTISAEVPGKLLSFTVDEGQSLSPGLPVAQVDTLDLCLKLKAMQAQRKAVTAKQSNVDAQVEVYRQQKDNLLVDKNRLEKLLKDKAATHKQMDDVDAAIRMADRQMAAVLTQKSGIADEYESLSQQIAQVDESIKKCRILNPIQGTVLAKYAEANEIVTMGKPLYKIADLSYLYLRVYVSGTQLPQLKLGQETEVLVDKDSKENRKLSGTISWIASSAEFTPKIIQTKEERVNLVYAVKIKVKNDGSLKIAMPGEANFK